ncbi:MAG: hypothetical protein R3B39_01870 [Candidatus Paceibacterota bacterium]
MQKEGEGGTSEDDIKFAKAEVQKQVDDTNKILEDILVKRIYGSY